MNTTAVKLTIALIEDCEGSGECQQCDRKGLRWVAVLSDGSRVGLECAKAVLGYRPARSSYDWTTDYTPVAQYVEYGETWVLWERKTGNATRETRSGVLVGVGGARTDWTNRGWL